MEQIVQYIKPELLIVAVILYFIGVWLKQAQTVNDKYIPLILGALGIALCAVWVLATCPFHTGILNVGASNVISWNISFASWALSR